MAFQGETPCSTTLSILCTKNKARYPHELLDQEINNNCTPHIEGLPGQIREENIYRGQAWKGINQSRQVFLLFTNHTLLMLFIPTL